LAATLAHGPAPRAQTGTGGTGGDSGITLSANDFLMRLDVIDDKDKTSSRPLTDYEKKYFFNQARCACGTKFRFLLDFSAQGVGKKPSLSTGTGTVQLVAGPTNCVSTDDASRTAVKDQCVNVGDPILLSSLTRDRKTYDLAVSAVVPKGTNGETCPTIVRTNYLNLYVDQNMDGRPDFSDANQQLSYDGQPPNAPATVNVSPGDEALRVSWSSIGSLGDFAGYLIFCTRGENLDVYPDDLYNNQYITPSTLVAAKQCPTPPTTITTQALTTDSRVVFADATGGTGGGGAGGDASGGAGGAGGESGASGRSDQALTPTEPFNDLLSTHLCSGLITSQTSTRLSGLQNGVPYLVGVAAADRSGNISPIKAVYIGFPISTRDFYEGYRDKGGKAEGGYCSFGTARARGFGLAGVLLAATGALTLRARRRRRAR
jgi:uncharacterized membrane protein YgcG